MKTHKKFRGINLGTMQPCSTKKYNPGCQSFFKLFCIRLETGYHKTAMAIYPEAICLKCIPPQLHQDKDTIVSVKMRFLHQSKYIYKKYINPKNMQCLDNCKIVYQENIFFCKTQLTVILTHK